MIKILDKSEALLAEITGKKPVGHRAPESVLQDFMPELLTERGYLYSSSMKDCDLSLIHISKAFPKYEPAAFTMWIKHV